MTSLSLAYSPCPNDTFMFYRMVHDAQGRLNDQYEIDLADIETLNVAAQRGHYDITKISFRALYDCLDEYELLPSGSALGFGCGPLLVGGKMMVPDAGSLVAIPGEKTTAHFLLRHVFGDKFRVRTYLFSEIEDAVCCGKVDAGVIIHENRFTFRQKGLMEIVDLGQVWEETTGLPIPLGGIAIRRSLPTTLKREVNMALKNSISFAMSNPEVPMDYVSEHAQTMDRAIMKRHIDLYVNAFSVDLGEKGKAAVDHMMSEAARMGMAAAEDHPIFAEL